MDQRWIVTSTGTALDRFQYGYDQDGNVLYKNNLVNSSFSELYHANGSSNGYDNLNQLVAFSRGTLNSTDDTISSPSASETWSMDAAGNFTSAAGTSETNNLQNEATAFGSSSLTYDSNGNLTTDQNGNTLVYDAWNRLVAYKSGSTTLETLAYDGRDRLIVQNPGTATDLYYSDQWQVLEERQGSTVMSHYVWSPLYVDGLVLRDRNTGGGTLSERLWVQQDANWNVTALVNGSGTVVERYVYDPYGVVTVPNASWGTLSGSAYAWIYGHQGGRWDGTTGLYAFGLRYESPTQERWTTVDPTGFAGGDTNLYRYVNNGPIDSLDPSGLWRIGIDFHLPLWGPLSFGANISLGTGGTGVKMGLGVGTSTPSATIFWGPGSKPPVGPAGTASIAAPVAEIPICGVPIPVGVGGYVDLGGSPILGPAPPAPPGTNRWGFGVSFGFGAYFDFLGGYIL